MFLQKRKNIKSYSRFLKTGYIPFDKLTDSFLLCKTIYHETSLVKFSDKVTHNMPVCVQTNTIKSRLLLYATNRETEKTNKYDTSKMQIRCISRLFLNDEKGFYILHRQGRFLSVCAGCPKHPSAYAYSHKSSCSLLLWKNRIDRNVYKRMVDGQETTRYRTSMHCKMVIH